MAFGVPHGKKAMFSYFMNIRKIVKLALLVGYWGNGCVPVYMQMSPGDLVAAPLWETVELVKKSKRRVTDEYVRSFGDFQELHYAKGITVEEGISDFTDWRHLGQSAVDYGWGGPVIVLPLYRGLRWKPCFFLPYASVGDL